MSFDAQVIWLGILFTNFGRFTGYFSVRKLLLVKILIFVILARELSLAKDTSLRG